MTAPSTPGPLVLPDDSPVPVIDAYCRSGFDGKSLDMPMELAALRDEESRAAWPSTDVAAYLFKHDAEYDERTAIAKDLGRWLEHLRQWKIDRAQVPVATEAPDEAFDMLADHADRVFVSYRMDPHAGMTGIRRLRHLAERYPFVRSVSISPHGVYPFIAPNSKEHYPIYAACIELGLAVTINVGFPGPRVPAWTQDPMHLDEVCWFFPELRVVMRHGGEPWVDTCVKMMLRWPNLYYATTAFAPRHLPPAIIDFLNRRGRDKVIFAGYWPTLPYERTFRELSELPIRPEALPGFLRDNAVRAFALG